MNLLRIFLLLFPISVAHAQMLSEDARFAAMNGASTAITSHYSPEGNPAGLAGLKKAVILLSIHKPYNLDELSSGALSLALPYKKQHVFACSYAAYGYSVYRYQQFAGSWSMQLNTKFSGGIRMLLHTLRIEEDRIIRPTIEAGCLFQLGKKGTWGVRIANPNQVSRNGSANETLPSFFCLGYGHRFSELFLLTLEASKDLQWPVMIKAGMEYFIARKMYVRYGSALTAIRQSAGIGIVMGKLQTDLAIQYHPVLGYSPACSISYAW